MKRREFITLLGGAAAPGRGSAGAAAGECRWLGFLNSDSPNLYAYQVRAFRRGLQEAGYVEGQNVAIEYRWAEGQYDQLPALVADLIRRQATVICREQPCGCAGSKGCDHDDSNRLRDRRSTRSRGDLSPVCPDRAATSRA